MRILVLSPDPLPLPGMPVCPLGLRAWSLAFGLKSAGHTDVRIAFPEQAGVSLPAIPGLETYANGEEGALLDSIQPDVLLVVSPACLLTLAEVSCSVILDVPRPEPDESGVAELRAAIARADRVTCATMASSHFLSPFLIDAGFDETLPTVVPPCLAPDQPPTQSRKGDPCVLALQLDNDFDEGELDTIRTIVEGKAGATLDMISPSDGVAFDQLLGRLAKADVAITTRPRSLSRMLQPSDATLIAMWAGVPCIHDADDSMGGSIASARAGWCADDDLPRLLGRLLSKPEDIRRRAPRASELVRSAHTWDNAIAPLSHWLTNGAQRRHRVFHAGSVTTQSAPRKTRLRRGELAAARSPFGRISYAPPPPAPEKATPLGMGVTVLAMALLLPIGLMLLLLFGLAELVRPLLASPPTEGRKRR